MTQQHTGLGILFSLADSVGLVMVGVLAAQADQLLGLVGMAVVAGIVALSRFLLAARVRREDAKRWLEEYLSDPSDLEDVLRDLASRGLKNPWSRRDLHEAIEWWFDEDLVDDWHIEQDYRNRKSQGVRSRLLFLKDTLRHPERMVRRAISRLETRIAGESSLKLLETVARIPYDDVARIITKAGCASGFVDQRLDKDEIGSNRVRYWSVFSKGINDENRN